MPDYPPDVDEDDFTSIGDAPPFLVPLSPVKPLTPDSECPHRGPLQKGVPFVCIVCHKSGRDHYRYFRNRKVKKPEAAEVKEATATRTAYRPPKEQPKLTRKQRRAKSKAECNDQAATRPDR